MKADRIDLFGLFNADATYAAPLFHRPYVLTEERNWTPLWDAVSSVAEQRLDGAPKLRPHFLGAVVLNQLPTPTGGVPIREHIDGQQPLTTLQVLLAATRDFAADQGHDKLSTAFAKLVENDVPLDDQRRVKEKVLASLRRLEEGRKHDRTEGRWLHYEIEDEDDEEAIHESVAAFERAGFTCRRDDKAVRQASDWDSE